MKGRLRLELRDGAGRVVDAREAHNSVLLSGADLIARLFSGQGAPITHMGVGVSDAPETETYGTEALTNSGDDALGGETETAIQETGFVLEPDPDRRVVQVRVRATLAAAQAVGTIREAGLMAIAGDTRTLYNRVIFAPLVKGDDHELSMFWEVAFPYGDLDRLY